MSKKQKNYKGKATSSFGKQIGKQQSEQKSDFYQKHKSTIWTIIVLIILTIFFIVNNTRKIPDQGSYPPNYNSTNTTEKSTSP